MTNLRRQIAAGLIGLLFATSGLQAQTSEFRGIWVDAWGTGFLDSSQVTQLISDCRAYNFNAVIVQMRRRGDAFYMPGITTNDPRTTALASGFDALQDILTKARTGSPRIEVHCWVTTFPVWSSETSTPSQSGHVFNLHPEYLMQNAAGNRFVGEGYYLDPGHPDATYWNYVMATNIVRRYDVDGFHWDYVRYPGTDSGYNPTAIARYNAEFGSTGQPSSSSAQFSNWRRRQVTDFLRWVNSDLLAIRPNLQISCSVFGSRTDAYNARFQDWAAWNSEGIIDLCMPMGYTDDTPGVFIPRVNDAFNHQGVRRVYMGQGGYLNTKEGTLEQLNYIRSKPLLGSQIYDYGTPSSGGASDRYNTFDYIKNNYQPAWLSTPAIPWKATPTKAILRGTVTRQSGGTAVYNATLTINTSPARNQQTEPHGKFAFFEIAPGTYTVTATGMDLGTVTTNVTITAGTNRAVALVLPPDTTAPVITAVAVENLTDTAATITWTTDENGNNAVDYGTTVSYSSVASNATMVLRHSVTLAGLTPNTIYHYRVRSRNAAGLQATSGDFSLTTNPAGVVNDVIVECRLADGSLNSNPPYSDSGFSDSTLKSSAADLTGQGSRYAGSGTPSFTLKPSLLVPGGTFDVYLTHGSATSVSDDIVAAVVQSGCTGLPATTTVLRESPANTWEYLGRLTLNPGIRVPTLTLSFSSGTPLSGTSRMYSDSAKFVYVTPPAPPTITTQPAGRAVKQGTSTTFTVAAAGATPLSYRWRFDGAVISEATTSSYTIPSVQPSNEGDYSVVVTNIAGAVTSNPAFLVVNIPPSITAQPQSQAVNQGAAATFTVTANGTEPLSCQWRFNGANLAEAMDSSYTRLNVQPIHAGLYSVVVTNVAGSVTSSAVTLTVNVPPGISAHPQSQAVKWSSNATFTVIATGTAPLSYLWQFNGANLPSATDSSYTRFNVQDSDAGEYSALVTNMAGAATSTPAVLSVIPPQTARFEWITRLPDGRIELRWTGEPGWSYLLQASTNFSLTNWVSLGPVSGSNGLFEFVDEAATNQPWRFYRTRQ